MQFTPVTACSLNYDTFLTQRRFRRRVLPGDFSSDETFRDVARFQIEMAVDRADLAGNVEARDRPFHRIEDALVDVMFGAALGVVDDGPGFHDVKGAGLDPVSYTHLR